MKQLIRVLLLSLITFTCSSKTISLKCNYESIIKYGDIEDGWYKATVKYSNYNTGTYATYTLKVYAEYGRITKIDFGNGGSVHSGYNNEGYIYSSGYLSYERDNNGNIIEADASVNVSDNDGMRNFKIIIE